MEELIRMKDIVSSLLYSLIGLGLFWAAVMIFDKVTPGDFWKEILEKQNTAVAIVVAALAIGISIIVGMSIHG
jgi:putative membrane protein